MKNIEITYGLPYQGSKNKIAEKIIDILPPAENFYDLFCGGCAVTHAAMLSDKWKNYFANDIDFDMPKLFLSAINGGYKGENRWISREDFDCLKDSDAYVSVCWSFGNGRKNYLYSKEIEPWKKALHYARIFNDNSLLRKFGINSDGSSADIKKHHDEYMKKYIRWYMADVWHSQENYSELENDIRKSKEELRQYLLDALRNSGLTQAEVGRRLGTQMQGHYFGKSQWEFPTREYYDKMREFMPKLDKSYEEIYGFQKLSEKFKSLKNIQNSGSGSMRNLQGLQNLEHLQRLNRLQNLKNTNFFERLKIDGKDYRDVKIKPVSVIYCDIPYENAEGYICGNFDHKSFYDWACNQKEPVFISSYEINDNRFECVFETEKYSLYNSRGNNVKKIEKLFIPKHQK